jgi:hypothetical protein
LSKQQREELAWLKWLQGVGTMGEYAGNAEMVLFTCLLGLYVIVKNTVKNGPEIQSSRMFYQKGSYPFSDIACKNDVKGKSLPPATIENTIFLWVIDPEDPCTNNT